MLCDYHIQNVEKNVPSENGHPLILPLFQNSIYIKHVPCDLQKLKKEFRLAFQYLTRQLCRTIFIC